MIGIIMILPIILPRYSANRHAQGMAIPRE
jgi:hypothetical protein